MKTSKKLFLLSTLGIVAFVSSFSFASAMNTRDASNVSFSIGGSTPKFNVTFYTSYSSSWGGTIVVSVNQGSSVSASDIPSISLSGYTLQGWVTVTPSSANYNNPISGSTISSTSVNADISYYPILKSNSDYAYVNSTYYQANVDVTINSNSIGQTLLGKRYVGISGIPNPEASWNDPRSLHSSSGIYKFENSNGAAMIYRKIGITVNNNWGADWDGGAPGIGIYAWQGESNVSIHMGYAGPGQTLQAYIPGDYENFKFSRYSHNQTSFVWGNQSSNLSFDPSWWWGGVQNNHYESDSINLAMKNWSSWIDNWGSNDALWS